MNFELILSIIIFFVGFILFLCWQPSRVVLKEIFFHPLRNSKIRIVTKKEELREEYVQFLHDLGYQDVTPLLNSEVHFNLYLHLRRRHQPLDKKNLKETTIGDIFKKDLKELGYR